MPFPFGLTWRKIRRVWVGAGIVFMIVFFGWLYFGNRATSRAHEALKSDDTVAITVGDRGMTFHPLNSTQPVGLIFFPGGLVEPAAYAPLARAVAENGYEARIVYLPLRGAFGGADGDEMVRLTNSAMDTDAPRDGWVLAGHSKGATIAAKMAHLMPQSIAGLILIGTTHPRDFSLAQATYPITKIFGTRDGIATFEGMEKNRHLLPASTRWVAIEGGNHSQFGRYGFNMGDRFASIDAEEQQQETIDAILESLRKIPEKKKTP